MSVFDLPDPGLSDNTVYDIIAHKNAIWMSTDRGISLTTDGGLTWNHYDTTNGMAYQEITAIYSGGDTLWVAVNSPLDDVLDGKGLNFTDDEGDTWGLMEVDGTLGPQINVFDIAGADSLIFFTAWAGGLGGSFDGGQTWQKIYYSHADSINENSFPPTNLYFAAVVDTFHTDTLMLWAGSADGLMRFMYAPDYAKPSSNRITNIFSGDGMVFICGDSGLTSLEFIDGIEVYNSMFETDGLTGTSISAAHYIDGILIVGSTDSLGGYGTGLARSSDGGQSFQTVVTGLVGFNGENIYAKDFTTVGDYVFMAGFEGGLYKSSDSGSSWEAVTIDADPASGRNIVHSLASVADTVWLGTDSGVVRLDLDLANNAVIETIDNFVFVDSDTSGGRCERIRLQEYYGDDDIRDSVTVWAIQHPINPAVGTNAIYFTPNDGTNWLTNDLFLLGAAHFDVDFIETTVLITGYGVVRWTLDKYSADWFSITGESIVDSLNLVPNNFLDLDITAIEIVGDTIYLGSEMGLAISPPSGEVFRWHLVVADTEPTHYFRVDRFMEQDGLSGNFVNALDIQFIPGGDTLIWASTHPGASGGGQDGISVSTLDGKNWDIAYTGSPCWNFEFYDSAAFAASNAGLLTTDDNGATWDTLDIVGTLDNYPVEVNYNFIPGTQVIGLLMINDTLWVGTEEGVSHIYIDDLKNREDVWDIYRVYDQSDEVYAYPVPFAPYDAVSRVSFHYPVPQDCNVTIEVYDFAMNLVRRVIDNEFHAGGLDVIWSSDRWDGINGNGDVVAAGIYYFKVSLSTGEIYWGKLAVKP
jgi:hypothetical protein